MIERWRRKLGEGMRGQLSFEPLLGTRTNASRQLVLSLGTIGQRLTNGGNVNPTTDASGYLRVEDCADSRNKYRKNIGRYLVGLR